MAKTSPEAACTIWKKFFNRSQPYLGLFHLTLKMPTRNKPALLCAHMQFLLCGQPGLCCRSWRKWSHALKGLLLMHNRESSNWQLEFQGWYNKLDSHHTYVGIQGIWPEAWETQEHVTFLQTFCVPGLYRVLCTGCICASFAAVEQGRVYTRLEA